jgi:transcriptional regulator with XRE-family HTH domain
VAVTTIGLLLDATGKTDWQVAQDTGIHPTVISRYRSGERRPHARHAQALAEYFAVPTDTILAPPSVLTVNDVVRVADVSGPIPLTDTIDDPAEWIDNGS